MKATQTKPTAKQWQDIFNNMQTSYHKPQEINLNFSEYFLDHFTNCLPPLLYNKNSVLCSEAYDHTNEGKGIYTGFFIKASKFYGVITTVQQFKKLV